jgi:hypothetical protein
VAPTDEVVEPAACPLRAGRGYELVLWERLTTAERVALGGTPTDDGSYGMLRPRRGSRLVPRTVSPDIALLFLTRREPGPLPAYARAALGVDTSGTIARLVLDGVLELEYRGEWYCGARAAKLLDRGGRAARHGRVGELSVAALQYGQALGDVPEDVLVMRLYSYGRLPISPQLRRQLPDEAAVGKALGLGDGGPTRRTLGATWSESRRLDTGTTPWWQWRPRTASGRPDTRRANVKLYLSPTVEALPDALQVLAELLAASPTATGFKIGVDLGGICRPDKVVVYFDRLEDLLATARDLSSRLQGVPAHGVPFTASVSDDGLLSWAADPEVTSWRLWVASRLAEYLGQARHEAADGPEPWRFALQRLRLDGVDPDTWIRAGGGSRPAAVG